MGTPPPQPLGSLLAVLGSSESIAVGSPSVRAYYRITNDSDRQ